MDETLKDLNIDIKSIICSFINLFYETNCKYSCTATKIGKLVSILAFKYAINGEKLFNETIYKYDNCGTLINEVMYFVDRDVYLCFDYQNDKKYIDDKIYDSINIPVIFIEKGVLMPPPNIITEIEDVFRNFGAYSQKDLGDLLNPIVNIATNESFGKIELSNISLIIEDLNESNEIVKYLKSSHLNNKNLSTKIKIYKKIDTKSI